MEAAWLLPHSGALPYWVVIVCIQCLEIVVPFIYLEINIPMEILPCGETWVAMLCTPMHAQFFLTLVDISSFLLA